MRVHATLNVLVLAVAGGVLVANCAPRLGAPTSAPPHVAVTADQVLASNGGARARIILRISAATEDLGPVSLFWQVALAGVDRGWHEPQYVSSAQAIDGVPAGESRTAEWLDTPLSLPPGRYDVSGWAHQVLAAGDTRHVAGGPLASIDVTRPVPSSVRLTQESFVVPNGPLALRTVTVDQDDPLTQHVSLAITIDNRADRPFGGRVYWVIGRFSDSEPFRTALWQTDWTTIPEIDAGASTSLVWQHSIGLPAGTYALSVWLHTRIDSTWEHSHRSFNIPIELRAGSDRIQRARPPILQGRVVDARPDPRGLVLVVHNDGPDQSVWTSHALVSDRRRFDWHQQTPDTMASARLEVPSGRSEHVLAWPLDCGSDVRFARVTLGAFDDVLVDVCS